MRDIGYKACLIQPFTWTNIPLELRALADLHSFCDHLEEIFRQYEGYTFSLDAIFLLDMPQEVTEVYVENLQVKEINVTSDMK